MSVLLGMECKREFEMELEHAHPEVKKNKFANPSISAANPSKIRQLQPPQRQAHLTPDVVQSAKWECHPGFSRGEGGFTRGALPALVLGFSGRHS